MRVCRVDARGRKSMSSFVAANPRAHDHNHKSYSRVALLIPKQTSIIRYNSSPISIAECEALLSPCRWGGSRLSPVQGRTTLAARQFERFSLTSSSPPAGNAGAIAPLGGALATMLSDSGRRSPLNRATMATRAPPGLAPSRADPRLSWSRNARRPLDVPRQAPRSVGRWLLTRSALNLDAVGETRMRPKICSRTNAGDWWLRTGASASRARRRPRGSRGSDPGPSSRQSLRGRILRTTKPRRA